ncbi:uncharacterized protein BCR38DRAFT_428570 [Pseudomassariella vexata]|uniref:Uncharacterized protein n=1 Tax=Pseudomassariella vexata TaxID=1141098 RepID=A0A1Y2E332_9PEZI|nr:uncharacterized protein BCR38DRAFT_428570 [Pseudomassariella vexata]ORY65857.1 hypothetical protein BCR38DRAFT_428570 [Pseudomassariella vexata]
MTPLDSLGGGILAYELAVVSSIWSSLYPKISPLHPSQPSRERERASIGLVESYEQGDEDVVIGNPRRGCSGSLGCIARTSKTKRRCMHVSFYETAYEAALALSNARTRYGYRVEK